MRRRSGQIPSILGRKRGAHARITRPGKGVYRIANDGSVVPSLSP
jgi:hypothetical protein